MSDEKPIKKGDIFYRAEWDEWKNDEVRVIRYLVTRAGNENVNVLPERARGQGHGERLTPQYVRKYYLETPEEALRRFSENLRKSAAGRRRDAVHADDLANRADEILAGKIPMVIV